jgi:bifunctional DNA-binding transcriptional regulator/antitoxin component of YhaV-PrlF toxin-antitoxin module
LANSVGPKGQVVIEKAIRDRLGVEPGWQAVQLLVDNHVEIYFIPPPHNRSLLGAAKPFIRRYPNPDEDWDEAVAQSMAEDYLNKMRDNG